MKKIQDFIEAWTDDEPEMKPVFVSLFQALQDKTQAELEFHERPGISYSLRGLRNDRNERPLFVMVDVIDDDPGQRWLSVCFYGDMIQDPDELGDLIPEGLLGADGYCFDISESDDQLVSYVKQRIEEAYSFKE
ncbi:hypothetical protein [uncultured Desulfosarcina sp.]|uniref:hypothetical protein n=1 Tax=uncultured Desulfosarcina sp. TaxID=218289 RepID=UPI0029C66D01|nr:hypothetical protein [uncultured Desulfosarcina sp.]